MDSFDFVTPINSGITKLCEILDNDFPDRDKIIDLARWVELKTDFQISKLNFHSPTVF